MERLIRGVERFQQETYPKHEGLFTELAKGQKPLALMITCSDSRIDPNLITQSLPGQLFVMRNAGNIVPVYTGEGAEAGTVEYAVAALGIEHVIVCGHTDCGAMKGVLNPASLTPFPTVANWLRHSACACAVVKAHHAHETQDIQLRHLIEENVVSQLVNLQTHPAVAARMTKGALRLHGWVYEIGTGAVHAYDVKARKFVPLRPSVLWDPPAMPAAIGLAPAFAD